MIPSSSTKDGRKAGFVPNFSNRYFTEDIPFGLCVYKGLADIAGIETPAIDKIIIFCWIIVFKSYILIPNSISNIFDLQNLLKLLIIILKSLHYHIF